MFKRSFVSAVLFTAALSVSVFSQTSSLVSAKFVSRDGGFAIDLPSNMDGGVRPVGDLNGGAGTYSWNVPDGSFTVGFVEGMHVSGDSFSVLNDFADRVTGSQSRTGGKIIERIEFSLDGDPGIQLKIRRGKINAINRFILARNRLYVLTADFDDSDGDDSVTAILDSFELLENRSLIA